MSIIRSLSNLNHMYMEMIRMGIGLLILVLGYPNTTKTYDIIMIMIVALNWNRDIFVSMLGA